MEMTPLELDERLKEALINIRAEIEEYKQEQKFIRAELDFLKQENKDLYIKYNIMKKQLDQHRQTGANPHEI